jgi:hypothetical protein
MVIVPSVVRRDAAFFGAAFFFALPVRFFM